MEKGAEDVKLFETDDKIIGGSIEKEETEAYLYAMQLSTGSVVQMTLKVVIELGVLDVIVRAGSRKFLSTKEIADELSIVNPDAPIMLDRMLRCLACHNILTCKLKSDGETDHDGTLVSSRLYGVAPVCRYFVKNEDGVSLGPFVSLVQDEVMMKSWYYLKDAVLNGGIPFDMAYGMSSFDYHGKDMRFNKLFNTALFNEATIIMKKILNSYNGFEGLNTLVDVGGGVGATLNTIVSKHPTIKGINFDLPHVIDNAPLIKGVKHVSGDMFEKVPSGDAIFMKSILHDWSDGHCVKILKNCWKQLPQKGKVIIAEGIFPVEPQQNNGSKDISHADMIMLTRHPGGQERTEKEFEFLAKKAGFTGFNTACNPGRFYIMEFTK